MGQEAREASIYDLMGGCYTMIGDFEKARDHLEVGCDLAMRSEDRILQGRLLNNLGVNYTHMGQLDEALQCYSRALEIRKGIDYLRGISVNQHNIGDLHFRMGNYPEAQRYFSQSLESARAQRWRVGEAMNLVYLGYFKVLDGEQDEGEEAAQFLRAAGHLCVTDVFDDDEVAGMLADAAVLADEAAPGDMTSWWGRGGDGTEVLTRVLRAASRPGLDALVDDSRVRRIVGLADEDLAPSVDDGPESVDRVTVLWKRPGLAEGLGDLPWHRDCGMGGHANRCPATVLTICLTDGSAAAGQLRFLSGSHRGSYPFMDGMVAGSPEGVGLDLGPGDVTLHYSDVMHASLPPTSEDGPHRISVLVGFAPANRGHHLGERHYNDALLVNDDGQVDHLGQRLERERSSSTSERDPGRGDG